MANINGFFKGKYSYQLTTIKLLEDRNENIFPGKQMFVTIETTYTIIRGALFVIYFEITLPEKGVSFKFH